MKNKLKLLAMSISIFGLFSPLVKISTSQINIYLGLLNIGFKPFILLALLLLILLHPIYLPKKFENYISIFLNTLVIICVFITFFVIKSKISNFKNGFGFNFLSSLVGIDIKIFIWSWLLILTGIILSIILSIHSLKKDNELIIEENIE